MLIVNGVKLKFRFTYKEMTKKYSVCFSGATLKRLQVYFEAVFYLQKVSSEYKPG